MELTSRAISTAGRRVESGGAPGAMTCLKVVRLSLVHLLFHTNFQKALKIYLFYLTLKRVECGGAPGGHDVPAQTHPVNYASCGPP